MTAICITAIIASVFICVTLAVLLYHQMVLVNEINKRLVVMAEKASEDACSYRQDMNSALDELERATSNQITDNNQSVYDEDLDI